MESKKSRLISATCGRPVVRVLLLVGVFAAAGWGFQWNFERRMAALNAGYVQDSGAVLSTLERKRLLALREMVQQALGMNVLVRVEKGKEALVVPPFPASTIFVGVNPVTAEAVIVLPPLAKKVMGEGTRVLAEEALSACVRARPVALCVEESVQRAFDALTAAE